MSACHSLNCDSLNPTASADVQYSDTDSAVSLPPSCHSRFDLQLFCDADTVERRATFCNIHDTHV
jgi:hypothetical protein